MKKTTFLVSVFVLALLLGAGAAFAQPMGPGYGPQGGYWNYCPYCGRPYAMGPEYGMGPGGRGGGYGMGPGMMHRGGRGPGYGMGPGMMYDRRGGQGYDQPYGPEYSRPQEPMGEKDAKGLLEDYLKYTRNPNLKLGKIKEVDEGFEAEIVTKDGSLVDKVFVDKYTGGMQSMY
jgi:hypothetical protein